MSNLNSCCSNLSPDMKREHLVTIRSVAEFLSSSYITSFSHFFQSQLNSLITQSLPKKFLVKVPIVRGGCKISYDHIAQNIFSSFFQNHFQICVPIKLLRIYFKSFHFLLLSLAFFPDFLYHSSVFSPFICMFIKVNKFQQN